MSDPDPVTARVAHVVPGAWRDRGGWPIPTADMGFTEVSIPGIDPDELAWIPQGGSRALEPLARMRGRLWTRIDAPYLFDGGLSQPSLARALADLANPVRGRGSAFRAPPYDPCPPYGEHYRSDAVMSGYSRRRMAFLRDEASLAMAERAADWLAHDGTHLYRRVRKPCLMAQAGPPEPTRILRSPLGALRHVGAYRNFVAEACPGEMSAVDASLARNGGMEDIEEDGGEIIDVANAAAGTILRSIRLARVQLREGDPRIEVLRETADTLWRDVAHGAGHLIARASLEWVIRRAVAATQALDGMPMPRYAVHEMKVLEAYARVYALPVLALGASDMPLGDAESLGLLAP